MDNNTSTYQNNKASTPDNFPPQHQKTQPGSQEKMNPEPITVNYSYKGSNKLNDLTAIISGGDSGIGQAVAVAFAKEGANIVIAYLSQDEDADKTVKLVTNEGRKCVAVKCNLKDEHSAKKVVDKAVAEFGVIDILVNNIAVQYPQSDITKISSKQLNDTFSTNIFSYFYMTEAAVPHLHPGSCIINTTSVTAYQGSKDLIDYSSAKGAIVSFTRSLSLSLADKGIRVNAVAPGPVWTPLIPSSFNKSKVASFGKNVPLGRAAQPFEIAPTYVYLASDDSAFVTGQVLHVNGGTITES